MAVLKRLVPRLGNNTMNYEPISLIRTLKTTDNGSHVAFHAKAQEIEEMMSCLKEDHLPPKPALRYPE